MAAWSPGALTSRRLPSRDVPPPRSGNLTAGTDGPVSFRHRPGAGLVNVCATSLVLPKRRAWVNTQDVGTEQAATVDALPGLMQLGHQRADQRYGLGVKDRCLAQEAECLPVAFDRIRVADRQPSCQCLDAHKWTAVAPVVQDGESVDMP